MNKLVLAAGLCLLASPALAKPTITVSCQQNTDDGRILFSNGSQLPTLPPGHHWDILRYQPLRSGGQSWTLGKCDVREINHEPEPIGHEPTDEQVANTARRMQEQYRGQIQQDTQAQIRQACHDAIAQQRLYNFHHSAIPGTDQSFEASGRTMHEYDVCGG